jgi:hypothetical protein
MRNVPPISANYAPRAGRTGWETRTGIITGFARGTPHDGAFFDHPDEVISGASRDLALYRPVGIFSR